MSDSDSRARHATRTRAVRAALRQGELRIEDDTDGPAHTLNLSGELDMATAAQLEIAIQGLCDDGVGEIVLDLDRLMFVDSAGLRSILRSVELCKHLECDLHLTRGSRSVRRLFEIVGLRDRLPFLPAEPDDAGP